MGRPPKYKTAEELQIKIDEYFDKGCNTRKVVCGPAHNKQVIEIKVVTITGLVRYCGFCSRQSFYDLEEQEEFSYTIKKARNRMEEEYEELLQQGLGAGAIFALKNFGWVDKVELGGEVKGGQKVVILVQEKNANQSNEGRFLPRVVVDDI